MKIVELKKRLTKLADKDRVKVSKRFFKTGPGEYGEGDHFIGVRVPQLRKLAKEFTEIELLEVSDLLRSHIHEERLLALLILIRLFNSGNDVTKHNIYSLYLASTPFINNWDLVDISAEHIVGAFLLKKSKEPIYRLAKSDDLWERRISILSTFHYIKRGEFAETIEIAKMLLTDKEDLIHKAVGWMLREVGKRDIPTEEVFLQAHYQKMPRTMLRYAIEKFPYIKRQDYLKNRV